MRVLAHGTGARGFVDRHIGPNKSEQEAMLTLLGLSSCQELVENTIPESIRLKTPLEICEPLSEVDALEELREIAKRNKIFRSYIGMGYFDTITPPVILRNILENPGWYTQYTPYQAEIAQGRLEALVNFQTVVSDLTGMELANASLLDEGTAAAEAMAFCSRLKGRAGKTKFFVASNCHPHVIEVVKTRAEPLGFEVIVASVEETSLDTSYFGVLLQYPASDGFIGDYSSFAEEAHEYDALVVASTDLLSLTLLTPPGEWGADIVVGNSQRFGVPLGCGGPHAAFFATREKYKRQIPGRVAGVSKDESGRPAYRLALQVREQHIRRDKATSNICTAQVLLAIIAGMYAVYHGADGLRAIGRRVASQANTLAKGLRALGYKLRHEAFFDTLCVELSGEERAQIIANGAKLGINFCEVEEKAIRVSLDETTTHGDIEDILSVFAKEEGRVPVFEALGGGTAIPRESERTSRYLEHPVFSQYRSETELLRYIYKLQGRDLSLAVSMIPLGSCTMKLNATAEMIPVTWPEFGRIHPFAPEAQLGGYRELTARLEAALAEITGFSGVSLQPNAGSQGEYAGLLVIDAYHKNRGEAGRNICLIPESAHGTNPASAVLAGMEVVSVKCDMNGNIHVSDLREKALACRETLAALMVTYPSTHGVFEEEIQEICKVVHECGGQVYLDGANLNAQVGLCSPGEIGADVCHINLHKTFCIPHGGGGPGVGPIAVASHLVDFLPGHCHLNVGGKKAVGAVSSAPWGSASILPISYAYVLMMGGGGLRRATEVAILNANYIAARLESHYPVLYRGKNGFVAHECILDLRQFKKTIGITVEDVAKRLMDYGFHAPTVSFPVVETLMVEPTESESKAELDRFCDAMIAIRNEISEVEEGRVEAKESVLRRAPHTALSLLEEPWNRPYTREKATYPAPWLKDSKFWPPVSRIDSAYGDRNLFCSCM